jgi:serine/threonine protein kinase
MPILLENQAEPIPGYRLLERLGTGGFGEVWKCIAPGGLHKAIKFVFGNLEDVAQLDDSVRAEQELRSLERIKNIRHPYILSLERYEIVDGQLMIVTELADCSLYDRFKECRAQGLIGIPREELLDYLEETAEALDVMTSKYDLLHLDIKPQNLFLVFNHIKIGDFGLVKDLEGMNASVTGGVTPVYAAPETFEGYVSRFSDQYSLAIVFQELLSGVRPFSGSNARQLMLQHLQAKPNLDPLPPPDRPVIARALAKKPAERFETCTSLVKALRNPEKFGPPPAEVPTEATADLGTKVDMPPRKPSAPGGPPPATVPMTAQHAGQRIDDYFELGPSAPADQRSSGAFTLIRKPKTAARIPPEDAESGVLRPVVLIGLGQFGRATLHWMRQAVNQRFGPNGLPIIKGFSIDTDPTAPGSHLAPITGPEDVLLTKLNRPARYIRSRDTLPPVENWLDANMLYRMPRTQTTNGIRALGRLAFVEHYRSFKARLERELRAVIEPDALNEAEKVAGQTFRSTQPRVYLIGHLGGGTASGMLIDIAYMTRTILRSLELNDHDVHAVLYLPDEKCMEAPDLAEANAVAALYELHHFQHAGQQFAATYESKMMHVEETAPPFTRYYLFEVPPRVGATRTKEPDRAREVIQQASNALTRVLVTPLGRHADPDLTKPPELPYVSVGLRTLNSPRKPLIRRTARLLLQRLLSGWLQPLSADAKGTVQGRIDGFFHFEKLTPEGLYRQFEQASASALGKSAEEVLTELIAPFQQGVMAQLPDAKEVKRALREIFLMLGTTTPDESTQSMLSGDNTKLYRFLRSVSEQAVRSGATRLVYAIYRHLDKPGLRQGAVEFAYEYALSQLDQWVAQFEAKAKAAETEYARAVDYLRHDLAEYERLRNVPKRKWPSMPTPGERLLAVFRARYRELLYERIKLVYTGFRGICHDQGREVKHCRERLNELLASLRSKDAEKAEEASPEQRETLSTLIPMGCKDLLQSVYKFCDSIPAKDLENLDTQIGERLEKNFPRLAEICLAPGEGLKPVSELIMRELSTYLEQRLSLEDAAGLFMESETDLKAALAHVYGESQPPVKLSMEAKSREETFLITPNTEAGLRLGQVATEQVPELQVVPVAKNDEVVICRLLERIELKDLKVLSEAGQQAYLTAAAIEHFTPHARQDIDTWHTPGNLNPLSRPPLTVPGE